MEQSELGRLFLAEHSKRESVVNAAQVLAAIDGVRESSEGDTTKTVPMDILRRELQDMSASIMQTRNEIAALKPEEAGNNRIMAATEELDAIVTACERATADILTATERMQEIGEKAREFGFDPELCDEIENHATDIFMACSFQDITGQRTTKVVNVLRYLEQRVNSMIDIWGVEGIVVDESQFEPIDKREDAHLLEGPQLEGRGNAQDDIDKLLHEALGS
jgi:chemotaxis regulatin CheY-phosphate phosphatase CheZ